MALPLPRVIPDVGPGGGLVTAMGGINALHNAMIERKINQIKAQYMPLTAQSEALSKLAYANLMGPQFLSKLLGNEGALANMSEDQKKQILGLVSRAGVNTSSNTLSQIPQYSGTGQPSTNSFSGDVKNAFMGLLGQGHQQQSNNPFSQAARGNHRQQTPQFSQGSMPLTEAQINALPVKRPKNGVSIEGQQWYDKNGKPVYDEDIQTPTEDIKVEEKEPTWAQKTGRFKGEIKQGEESGKYRAKALYDTGQSLLTSSSAGAAQNELIKVIKDPIFQNARATIPAFQKQQLSVLKVTGSPELRKKIGEFISAGNAVIANQVANMGSKHLVREYDLAEKQKINDSDTTESAEGKLTNAKNLHDIAEQKLILIKNLLKKGIDEADAVEIANKKIDVGAIRHATDKLLERTIEIKNSKTGVKKTVTVSEARKLGVPNV